MTENRTYLLALAGLLHGIGMFAVRAEGAGPSAGHDDSQVSRPRQHTDLTNDFMERYVPAHWAAEVRTLSRSHGPPQRAEDKIVQRASGLAAGDRDAQSEETDLVYAPPSQLLSIFCDLQSDGQFTVEDRYWPLMSLDAALGEQLSEKREGRLPTLFPAPAESSADLIRQRYQILWNDFCRGAAQLRDAQASAPDLPAYVAGMLLLMQRYLWCVPSTDHDGRSDVSLYDHSRITSALAAVLPPAETAAGADAALLVGGDLSGVQNFLYTITARGATSALRGRSFFLQLLTEAVARFMLRILELPVTNLIYVGGGNFYLLARPQDAEALQDAQRYLSTILHRQYKGELYVALAAEGLKNGDFSGEQISLAWGRLHERLQSAKRRRFAELGEQLAQIFAPDGQGGDEAQQCQVCGTEHPGVKAEADADDPGAPGVRKCPACRSFEELGKDLRNADFLVLDELPLPDRTQTASLPGSNSYKDVLALLGLRALLQPDVPDRSLPPKAERRTVLALSAAALPRIAPGARTAAGLRLLVNVTPLQTAQERDEIQKREILDRSELSRPEQIKTFSELAIQSQGITRLGLLRMDVDNAGALFAHGFERDGKSIASLARIAALSFALDIYFSGWVARLAEAQTDNRRRLYSIYAGGDDLFFVGSWDAVVRLAQDVRRNLTPYAAKHPGIHASAGLYLVGMKYPLAAAAQEAGEAEEEAKRLQWWDGDVPHHKDAVTFLGKSLPWRRFGLDPEEDPHTRTAQGIVNLLLGLGDRKEAMPVVRRLADLSMQYEEAEAARLLRGGDTYQNGKPRPVLGPFMWRAVYTFREVVKRAKGNDVKQLLDELKAEQFTNMEWIGLAARWAELKLRQDGESTR